MIESLWLRRTRMQKYHSSSGSKTGFPNLSQKPLRRLRMIALVTPSLSSLGHGISRNPLFVWQMMRQNWPARSSLSPCISNLVKVYNKEVPYSYSSSAIQSRSKKYPICYIKKSPKSKIFHRCRMSRNCVGLLLLVSLIQQ